MVKYIVHQNRINNRLGGDLVSQGLSVCQPNRKGDDVEVTDVDVDCVSSTRPLYLLPLPVFHVFTVLQSSVWTCTVRQAVITLFETYNSERKEMFNTK